MGAEVQMVVAFSLHARLGGGGEGRGGDESFTTCAFFFFFFCLNIILSSFFGGDQVARINFTLYTKDHTTGAQRAEMTVD